MIPPGTYEFGPSNGKLLVKTGREGVGGKMGHDLVIEVTRWKATVIIDPNDVSQSTLNATAEIGSFEVREGAGGLKPLSDSDRADIKQTIENKILDPRQDISFRSTSVRPLSENRATVSGDLTIVGVSQPADLHLTSSGTRITGTMTVVQTKYGIKPFKAFMGALKVKDAVEIEIEATVPG
ncbi:MAG: YceI family protein [Actinomycetota bacterium]